MLTLIGTLGGVVITAAFGLYTAYLAQRWQIRRVEQEHRLQVERELRTARRETYARYIIAVQRVFDRSLDLYRRNRAAPIETAEFSQHIPQGLVDALVHVETCRVEALLLAGEQVRSAIDDYSRWLRKFWPEAASGAGTSRLDDRDEDAPYHRLIRAMQAELSNPSQAGP
jgi:hypothetical protein